MQLKNSLLIKSFIYKFSKYDFKILDKIKEKDLKGIGIEILKSYLAYKSFVDSADLRKMLEKEYYLLMKRKDWNTKDKDSLLYIYIDSILKENFSYKNITFDEQFYKGNSFGLFYDGNELICVGLYDNDNIPSEFFIKKKYDIKSVLNKGFWKNKSYLKISYTEKTFLIEDFKNELNFNESNLKYKNKNIIIVGPSGSGKTTIANKIITLYDKVLYMKSSFEVDKELLSILKPELIYIDDIVFRKDGGKDLQLLEDLQNLGIKILITYMDDTNKLEQGSFYVPGIRPGRFDSFIKTNFLKIDYIKSELKNKTNLSEEVINNIEEKKLNNFTYAYLEYLIEKINYGEDLEETLEIINLVLPNKKNVSKIKFDNEEDSDDI